MLMYVVAFACTYVCLSVLMFVWVCLYECGYAYMSVGVLI